MYDRKKTNIIRVSFFVVAIIGILAIVASWIYENYSTSNRSFIGGGATDTDINNTNSEKKTTTPSGNKSTSTDLKTSMDGSVLREICKNGYYYYELVDTKGNILHSFPKKTPGVNEHAKCD